MMTYQEQVEFFQKENDQLKAKVAELEQQLRQYDVFGRPGREAELQAMQNILNENKRLEQKLAQAQAAL